MASIQCVLVDPTDPASSPLKLEDATVQDGTPSVLEAPALSSREVRCKKVAVVIHAPNNTRNETDSLLAALTSLFRVLRRFLPWVRLCGMCAHMRTRNS